MVDSRGWLGPYVAASEGTGLRRPTLAASFAAAFQHFAGGYLPCDICAQPAVRDRDRTALRNEAGRARMAKRTLEHFLNDCLVSD